jgi:hypothetical protein
MGRKGGKVSIQSTRDQSGRESHHDAKEGFQVSKKGIQGRGQGFPSKGVVNTKNQDSNVEYAPMLYSSCEFYFRYLVWFALVNFIYYKWPIGCRHVKQSNKGICSTGHTSTTPSSPSQIISKDCIRKNIEINKG